MSFSLAVAKDWLSVVAVPVTIAVVGWQVQNSLSEAGLNKDYVAMAITILKEPATRDTTDLRLWAVSVLEKHSPVPLPEQLKARLYKERLPDLFYLVPYGAPQTYEPKDFFSEEELERAKRRLERAGYTVQLPPGK